MVGVLLFVFVDGWFGVAGFVMVLRTDAVLGVGLLVSSFRVGLGGGIRGFPGETGFVCVGII